MALFIGKESGIENKDLDDWYGKVVLGEMSIGELFMKIERRITDAGLLNTFSGLKRSLPFYGG